MALKMANHIFRAYRVIGEVVIKENSIVTMRAYQPSKSLAQLIE